VIRCKLRRPLGAYQVWHFHKCLICRLEWANLTPARRICKALTVIREMVSCYMSVGCLTTINWAKLWYLKWTWLKIWNIYNINCSYRCKQMHKDLSNAFWNSLMCLFCMTYRPLISLINTCSDSNIDITCLYHNDKFDIGNSWLINLLYCHGWEHRLFLIGVLRPTSMNHIWWQHTNFIT